MMKALLLLGGLCLALCLALGLSLHKSARTGAALNALQARLDQAEDIQRAQERLMERLERHLNVTNAVLAAWHQDRDRLDSIRTETRQALKEALRDAPFNSWAETPAPAAAWSLLHSATDQPAPNPAPEPTPCPAPSLPRN